MSRTPTTSGMRRKKDSGLCLNFLKRIILGDVRDRMTMDRIQDAVMVPLQESVTQKENIQVISNHIIVACIFLVSLSLAC